MENDSIIFVRNVNSFPLDSTGMLQAITLPAHPAHTCLVVKWQHVPNIGLACLPHWLQDMWVHASCGGKPSHNELYDHMDC